MGRKKLFALVFANWLVIPSVVAMLIGQFILPTSASTNKKVEMSAKNPVVEMDTNKGVIKIEIFEDNAPNNQQKLFGSCRAWFL